MTALRIIDLILWGLLALYMIPGAWSTFHGKALRRGDPMRLGVMATALLVCGYSLRWLIAPDNVALWMMLQVLSGLDAIYIALLARSYGRGPRVG